MLVIIMKKGPVYDLILAPKDQLAQADDLVVTHVKANDARALLGSLAFHRLASFEQIFQPGRWSNHSTFTESYMKDLAVIGSVGEF